MTSKSATTPSTAVAWWSYLLLSAVWVGLIQLARRVDTGAEAAWWIEHVLPPGWCCWPPRCWLAVWRHKPTASFWASGVLKPVIGSLPLWVCSPRCWCWCSTAWGRPGLWSGGALRLTAKLALNQGLLEEWLARGLLLGWLLKANSSHRRALWLSSLAFGLMHIIQFLFPPYTPERLINGIVLAALTVRSAPCWHGSRSAPAPCGPP